MPDETQTKEKKGSVRAGVIPMPAMSEEHSMKDPLAQDTARGLEIGDIVEGVVVAVDRARVFIDIAPHGTGLIFGREYMMAKDMLRNVNIGDSVKGKIVERENENGYIELSLKEARQALVWSEAERVMRSGETLSLAIKEANKGGLIVEWQGILGFLPASQLKSEHYPRVGDGNKDDIMKELKKLVGESLQLMVIGVQPKEGKLIFSEKGNMKEERKEIVTKYQVGDDVECTVSGIVDFGVFLKLEEGLEGLVHISELDWSLVDHPRTLFKMGDSVRAKIIDIKDGKVSLSIKALKQDPWQTVAENHKKGDEVTGVVIKFNKHGALVSIQAGVAGLVHMSDFGDEKKLREALSLGKSYKFTITLFEPKEHRMTLEYKA
jgi:small subunit ribosomal protein S1